MSDRPSPSAISAIDEIFDAAIRHRRPICLDSAPLIDYIAQNEPVSTLLVPLLEGSDVPVVISTITLAEVVGRPAIAGDIVRVTALHEALSELTNLTIRSLDQPHAIEAAFVRGLTGLRLPDAAVVATARLSRAGTLIGNDRQWLRKPLGVPYVHLDDVLSLE